MKQITSNIGLFLILSLLLSCGTEPNNTDENLINPNIIKVIDCCDRNEDKYVSGNFYLGIHFNENLITTGPITSFTLDEKFSLDDENEIWKDVIGNFENPFGTGSYLTINNSGENILFVKSSFRDVSVGSLFEYDLTSNELIEIRDSSFNISSSVYFNNDDSKLIYYSYGNNDGLEAGYYLHNKTNNTDSLLVKHISNIGQSEMLNGFDLSSNNNMLLIPDVRASQTELLPPQIIEYNLSTGRSDTLNVEFNISFARIGLWLRYSPDNNQILYSNFPSGSLTETTNDDSEMGIIDRQTGEKRVLNINTNPNGSLKSVQLAPTWSPNGNNIIYGSAPVFFPSGAKGSYSLFVLKDVANSTNYN
jgi:hypothetical protein